MFGPRYVDFAFGTDLNVPMNPVWKLPEEDDKASMQRLHARYYHFACDVEKGKLCYGPLNPRTTYTKTNILTLLSGHCKRFWELDRHFPELNLSPEAMNLEGGEVSYPKCVAGYVARLDNEVEFTDESGHFYVNYEENEVEFLALLKTLNVGTVKFRHAYGAGYCHNTTGKKEEIHTVK